MATRKSIEVDVITSSHWATGVIYPEARGLFSHMNMPTESAIEIEAGELTTLFKRSQSAESFGRMWLVKREIVAILVGNRAGLGPSNVLQAGYTKPFPHSVQVLLEGYELYGKIHSVGRFDFSKVIFEGDSLFTPLYDARIQSILFPKTQADAPALLFNRKRVQGLTLISSEPPG
jgi:hypothetical protein